MSARGIRNNNPGNVERGVQWSGLAAESEIPDALLAETRFAIFRSPHWGIRAMARILRTYKLKHRIDTIAGLINRWAPPIENDSGAYAAFVADQSGIGVNEEIDLENYDVLARVIPAMIHFENGQQPYSDETIDRALEAAEVAIPARFPFAKS